MSGGSFSEGNLAVNLRCSPCGVDVYFPDLGLVSNNLVYERGEGDGSIKSDCSGMMVNGFTWSIRWRCTYFR